MHKQGLKCLDDGQEALRDGMDKLSNRKEDSEGCRVKRAPYEIHRDYQLNSNQFKRPLKREGKKPPNNAVTCYNLSYPPSYICKADEIRSKRCLGVYQQRVVTF